MIVALSWQIARSSRIVARVLLPPAATAGRWGERSGAVVDNMSAQRHVAGAGALPPRPWQAQG